MSTVPFGCPLISHPRTRNFILLWCTETVTVIPANVTERNLREMQENQVMLHRIALFLPLELTFPLHFTPYQYKQMDFTTHSRNTRCCFYAALLRKQSLVFCKQNKEIILVISWVLCFEALGFCDCVLCQNEVTF